ncbi:unnamed protein product [Rhizoctonia solani]|uniref:RING-type domain-containing protein n=1 Tax=Rhizoctonia solani TaxID=456999 RepID=A0A8H3GK46_9AGAM|nr:unnamed protein product [Rhizoctonia solani]CAE6454765.1 unnamed protein product [Rhizoctonia solani]
MSPPSTPPLLSPPSPTTPRNSKSGSLCTPRRLPRGKRSNVAPLTPQSLVASRTTYDLHRSPDNSSSHLVTQTPPSIPDSNWRIHEESLSPTNTPTDTRVDEEQLLSPTTPNKLAGPFTPQVIKKPRGSLRFDIPNLLSDDPATRGSFTDPPPRRRETRLPLNDDNYVGPDQLAQDDMSPRGSPMSTMLELLQGTKCASCGGSERLSLLEPCRHHICASCVTGSLNVVGEKDMICMYCLSPIKSFKITRAVGRIHSGTSSQDSSFANYSHQMTLQQDSPTARGLYDLALPRVDFQPSPVLAAELPIVVLRIDNVPWDITPPMIEKWLGNPTLICHVLLDRVDGRTLNHAYVETTIEYARSALRTHQNKVLGYGRRARAATITLSSQQELMHALFPSWPGRFEGALPVYEASPTDSQPPPPADLLTESELVIILHLIQSPKSHFLKLPCLAYWSLISILAKIPVPDVFAPGTVPDTLFDITALALEKYELLAGARDYDPILHTKLIDGAHRCRAFTDRQLSTLFRFTHAPSSAKCVDQPSNLGPRMRSSHNQRPLAPPPIMAIQSHRPNESFGMDHGPFVTLDACDRVAQDFGLDSMLVHALAERLVFHSSTDLPPFRHH